MATSPAPDAAAPPGMCPGIAVLGGGGDGGDGDGDGSGGGDGAGGDGSGNGDDADGNGKGGAGCGQGDSGDGGGCPNHHGTSASGTVSAGDPVDVVTGRVFTVPVVDLNLPGPLPLHFERRYSTSASDRDIGLGFGFTHSFAWEVIERRRRILVHTHDGLEIDFGTIAPGEGSLGPHGWILHREGTRFVLDLPGQRRLLFEETSTIGGGKRHRLTGEADLYGNRISISYRDGVLAEIVDSVGRIVHARATREGRIESLSLKNALQQGQWIRVVQYGYDSAGRLVSVEDADGVRTELSYDESNRLISQKRPCGLTFFYRYDNRGRCVETWGAFQGAKDPSLAPDVPTELADGTRAKGVHHATLMFGDNGYSEVTTSVTSHRYVGNAHGKLDKAVAAGAVFTRTFNDQGFLLAFEDACQATTRWERDLQGRETKIVDALGNETQIVRDPDGHIREIVEPGGGVTRVERGPSMLSWRDPIGAMFQVHTEARGLIDHTIAPNGDVTHYRYDEHGNLVERTNAQGGVSRAQYDGWGRCTSMTDAAGATTRYVYSSGGRVLIVTSPDGETIRYDHDKAGRVVAITDSLGRTTQAYGGFDRLCEVVAPNGERVSLRYDREGLLSTVTNARGEVNRFVRRVDGMVCEEHTFDGRKLYFKHDAMGREIAVTNGAGQIVEIERDILGRMVKRTSDGVEESFEHDVRGDVIRATSGQVEVLFERNALGWIVKETQRVGGEAVVVDLAYDQMGTLARRGTSRGHSLAWERHGTHNSVVLDGRDRIDVTYDAVGRELGRRLPQGGLISTIYDVSGRLAARQVLDPKRAPQVGEGEPAWLGGSEGTATVEQRYSFSAGLLAKRWDRALGLTSFEYDPLGRLLSVIPENRRAELFRYGPGGELHDANAQTRAYGPGGRPMRSAEKEYTWDDAGRVVEAKAADGERTRYEWSGTGQLLAVARADGRRIEFEYDAFNRRMTKRSVRIDYGVRRMDSVVRFVWDSTTLVHEIRASALEGGDPVVEERTFCFEEHRSAPWAQRDARIADGSRTESGWFHYLNDDSGAPERLVDGRGRVACELRLTTWGHGEVAPGGVTSTPFRFRGQYSDEETGLSYNFHRYYDPATGRYLSADPIGLAGGLDVFTYAKNCPTSAVDVEGLMPYSVIKNKKGVIVAEGESIGKLPPGTEVPPPDKSLPSSARPSCAETAALGDMAKKMREIGMSEDEIEAEMKKNFAKDEYTIETYEGNKEDYDNGKRVGMNPCKKCGKMFKDMGIQDAVRAPNTKPGGKMKKWDQKSHHIG